MSKIRVIYNPDDTVSVIHPAPNSIYSEQECLDRSTPPDAEFDDVDSSELPQDENGKKINRHQWVRKKTGDKKGIEIDPTKEEPKTDKQKKKEDAVAKLVALGLTQEEAEAL